MTKEADQYRKRKIPLWLTLLFIRWWAVGAVYFLIGWGTTMGRYTSVLDLVVTLGVIIGLIHSFVLNPIFKQLYNWGWYKTYGNTTFLSRFFYRLSDMAIAIFNVIVVTGIYRVINETLALYIDGGDEKIFLPGEPILFGLFYALVSQVILALIMKITKRKKK